MISRLITVKEWTLTGQAGTGFLWSGISIQKIRSAQGQEDTPATV
jgi:hypothetical protein